MLESSGYKSQRCMDIILSLGGKENSCSISTERLRRNAEQVPQRNELGPSAVTDIAGHHGICSALHFY